MRKLKRFYSKNDIYVNETSCLLEDLFENNKLEYVSVLKGQNISESILLNKNIELLHYLNAPSVILGINYFGDKFEKIYDTFK